LKEEIDARHLVELIAHLDDEPAGRRRRRHRRTPPSAA